MVLRGDYPAADPDGDGLTNLQEWQAGTDPAVSNGTNTINATTTTPTVGQTIELWISNAWSNIKSVVFSFADGVANFATKTAAVVNGVSEKISGYFTAAGQQTVTATYKDASGNTVGTGTLKVTVTQATVTTTATIDEVRNDNTTPNSFIPKDSTTSDNTPQLSGSLSAELGQAQVLNIYNGSTLLGGATVNNSTKSWVWKPASALSDGSYTFSAKVRDVAYSVDGPAYSEWTIKIQTAPPSNTGSFSVSASSYPGVVFTNPLDTAANCTFTGSGTWVHDNITSIPSGVNGTGYVADSSFPYVGGITHALIAQRITGGKYLSIGTSGTASLAVGEQLYFLMNDTLGTYADNTGSASVGYSCSAAQTLTNTFSDDFSSSSLNAEKWNITSGAGGIQYADGMVIFGGVLMQTQKIRSHSLGQKL